MIWAKKKYTVELGFSGFQRDRIFLPDKLSCQINRVTIFASASIELGKSGKILTELIDSVLEGGGGPGFKIQVMPIV